MPDKHEADAELTALINSMLRGENTAANRALGQLLPALRREARKRLKDERRRHDLETDVLVDTAVRRVIRPARPVTVTDRAHFLNLAKLQMNRKLIERSRLDEHHRHDTQVQPHHVPVEHEEEFVAHATISGALDALRTADPVRYRVLVMRDVRGESWQDIADAFNLSVATVKYRHAAAYAWLAARVGGSSRPPASAT
jgi:DNA-directed RNA polymerase specialized sigma24 family protein